MSLWNLLEEGVARDPEAPATVGARGTTYGALRERILCMADQLIALGLGKGDRVAALAANSPAFLELYFATAGIGAILVPIGTRLAQKEIQTLLKLAMPRVLLADPDWRETVQSLELQPETQPLMLASDTHTVPGLFHWNGAPLARSSPKHWHPTACAPSDVAQIYYTSGTTGQPKGVMLTHGNVEQHARWAIAELRLSASDTWGHFAPMFHLADAWATFAATAVGAAHAFQPRFDAAKALQQIVEERITLTNLVPVMLQRMLVQPKPRPESLAGLRLILSGGAPIAPVVVERILDFFNCEYAQTYGLTETSPYLTISTPGKGEPALAARKRLTAVSRTGRAFGEVELRLVDDAGDDVPKDDASVGEIWARSPTITPGYWENPQATAEAFKKDWFCTGDLATCNGAGSYQIVDRKKDMILTGGENVYSTEVEAVILGDSAVLEAAVFGVPSQEWGEEVRAAVVWKPASGWNGLSSSGPPEEARLNRLRAHLSANLARFKCPKVITILAELPRTSSGKIKKRDLRESSRE